MYQALPSSPPDPIGIHVASILNLSYLLRLCIIFFYLFLFLGYIPQYAIKYLFIIFPIVIFMGRAKSLKNDFAKL